MTRLTRSPSVALLGEQAPPRFRTLPARVVDNSWEEASDLCAGFGLVLDAWQDSVLAAALGERFDGSWAAKQVGLSAPRQNGKSQMIVARALAGALLFGERKIIISAHQQDTARETFTKFLELIEESSALAERVAKVMNAFNRESITFTNGAHVQFKARSTAGGRGFSSDCLLLDEAQILGMPAWRSINSTMSARTNPQVWLLGTPPTPEDNGEVFSAIRATAIGGHSSTLAWLEWGAELEDDPALTETRRKANPAWDTRINHEVVQGEYETYSRADFALERLGIWASEYQEPSVIMADEWKATRVDKPPVAGTKSFGVKFSADGSRVAVAGAIRPDAGPIHVELVGSLTGSMSAGTTSLVAWLSERWRDVAAIVVDGPSHAGAFVNALREAGVPAKAIITPSWPEVASANSMLLDAVVTRQMTHLAIEGQGALDASALGTTKKLHGDKGAWSWAPINPSNNEIPVGAAALAHYGAKTKKRKTGRVVTA